MTIGRKTQMTLLPHSRNEAMKALLAKAEAKPKPVKSKDAEG